MTLIETERLALSEPGIAHAEGWFELNSDSEVLKYTGDKAFESLEQTKEFLSDYLSTLSPGFGRLSIHLKETNEFVGWCGLKEHESFVDLGYRINKKYWGNGYATEAAQASLKFGFEELGLDEITGRSAAENIASIKILEKLGMKFLRLEECHGIPNARVYSINKWEYSENSNG